jgi:hypothetical protein
MARPLVGAVRGANRATGLLVALAALSAAPRLLIAWNRLASRQGAAAATGA